MNINVLFDKLPKEEEFLKEYALLKGVKESELEGFFNPSLNYIENPSNYNNITKAAETIAKHVSNDSKFAIVLHIDMDSMFSNSFIYMYLKELNPNLNIDVVFPKTKAQGFNDIVMGHLRETKPNIVWMADAGSSDIEQVKELNQMGIDVVISDHHSKSFDNNIEEYCCFVNNQYSNVQNKFGSGCLVSWKVAQHIDWMNGIDDSDKYVDLVALSLLSDVCDTRSLENRAILNCGLNNIINPLIKTCLDKLEKTNYTYPEQWGWRINPLWNGSIKMDYVEEIFWGLVSPNDEATWKQGKERITTKKGTCLERALYIIRNKGKEKKPVVESYFLNLDKEGNDKEKVILAFDDGSTHRFLGGDVASKFSGVYNKPCLMFMDSGEDYYTGSLRSPVGLRDVLKQSGLFDYVAGK